MRIRVVERMCMPHCILSIFVVKNPCLRINDISEAKSKEAILLFETSALFDLSDMSSGRVTARASTVKFHRLFALEIFFWRSFHFQGKSEWLSPFFIDISDKLVVIFIALSKDHAF